MHRHSEASVVTWTMLIGTIVRPDRRCWFRAHGLQEHSFVGAPAALQIAVPIAVPHMGTRCHALTFGAFPDGRTAAPKNQDAMTKLEFPGPGLSADQWHRVDALAADLTLEQAVWISGFFAGLGYSARGAARTVDGASRQSPPIAPAALRNRNSRRCSTPETGPRRPESGGHDRAPVVAQDHRISGPRRCRAAGSPEPRCQGKSNVRWWKPPRRSSAGWSPRPSAADEPSR